MSFLSKFSGGTIKTLEDHAAAARNLMHFASDSYRTSNDLSLGASPVTCSIPECVTGWNKRSRKQGRPIFEGKWGCSGHCLRTLLRMAVRRELGDSGSTSDLSPHRHRIPLGLVLLAQGWVTHPQLLTALEAQKANGHGRIGDWLASGCGLDEERITRGLAIQWGCPVLNSNNFSAASMALIMPKRFVEEFGLLPLRIAGSSILYVAFQENRDAAAALSIEQMSSLSVECGLLKQSAFGVVKAELLAAEAVPATMGFANDSADLAEKLASVLEGRQAIASRLVRIHQYYWLRVWLESGAMSSLGTLARSPEDVADYVFAISKNSVFGGGNTPLRS